MQSTYICILESLLACQLAYQEKQAARLTGFGMKRGRRNQNAKKSMAIRAVSSRRRLDHVAPLSQRARGLEKNVCAQFAPPEDWHEPTEEGSTSYHCIVQEPGEGYRHVVTEKEVRERLGQLPTAVLAALEVVQLSRMTKKKQSFPCYGMQWGSTLYLYPIEESLIEYFPHPPRPAQYNEARQYGGKWLQKGRDWQLIWTEAAIRDFYLNNILIHELGHLLDDRNTSYTDRERYAEWFAIEHGFKKSKRTKKRQMRRRRIQRRHHAG